MIINDISRNKLVRYFSGPSDTSNTANSSDASKTSASNPTKRDCVQLCTTTCMYQLLISLSSLSLMMA